MAALPIPPLFPYTTLFRSIGTLAATLGNVGASASAADPPLPVVRPPLRTTTLRYLLCGAIQLALMLGYACTASSLLTAAVSWLAPATSLMQTWAQAALLTSAGLAGAFLLPVLAKWLLVGRFTVREFPLWGWRFLRLWTVGLLVRRSPMVIFVGTPL